MSKVKTSLKSIDRNSTTLFGIIIIIFAIMSILAPKTFLSITNLQGMGIQFAEFGILAMGMMLAMISGGIDLSLVGIANFSGIVASVIMIQLGGTNSSIIVGFLVALLIGALCGTFNGFLIGYMQIPPMLVTLCGLQLYTGLGLLITKGPAITGLPPAFSFIANGTILGIPVALILFILVVVFVSFLLNSTIYGQHVRFMGTNATASKYSGINNLKATLLTYGISGILGSIGGVIMASHYNSAKSDYGTSYTLLTLLIVVLGGTNPNGGYGKVSGVTLSIIVLQLISSAFNLLRVNSFIKTFVWGILLLVIMIRASILEKKQLVKREG
jgi:simple sugar transport system permease protein